MTEAAQGDSNRQITVRMATIEAIREEMRRDPRVFVMGEDARSPLWVSGDLVDEFSDRILNTPISEAAFVGAAVGAAMTGLRPIVDMTISSLMFCAMDQFISQAAKSRYMFGGQVSIPVVYRAGVYYGSSSAAQHSDRPHPLFMATPGLKVVFPASPYDVKGLLAAAIRDDNPVIFLEDRTLGLRREHVPDEAYVIPLGKADVKRVGDDATVVTVGGSLVPALEAALDFEGRGTSIEVIDVRTLVPLDFETILASVAKTGRLVVVDPAHRTCSAASEIAAHVAEDAFDSLRAQIVRVTTPDVPIPFSPALERPLYPDKARIMTALERVLGGGSNK